MNDLTKVMKIIKQVNKGRKRMSGQQYMDLMVALKGLEANLENGASFKKKRKAGKFKPCKEGELKVGDKVWITDIDDPGTLGRGDLRWANYMNRYKGQTSKIRHIDSDGDCQLEITGGSWFAPEWLEKVM